MAAPANAQTASKTWELSLYELHRTPQVRGWGGKGEEEEEGGRKAQVAQGWQVKDREGQGPIQPRDTPPPGCFHWTPPPSFWMRGS